MAHLQQALWGTTGMNVYKENQYWCTHRRNCFSASARTERGSSPDTNKHRQEWPWPWPQGQNHITVHYQAPTGCQFCWRHSTHIPLHESCKVDAPPPQICGDHRLCGHLSRRKDKINKDECFFSAWQKLKADQGQVYFIILITSGHCNNRNFSEERNNIYIHSTKYRFQR